MAQTRKRRPVKFFDNTKTTTIVLKHKDTDVPALGRIVEMPDGTSAMWLMEGFFQMKPGRNFEAVDRFEDPNAAMNAAIAKLKGDPDFSGMSDDQLSRIAQKFGLVGKKGRAGGGTTATAKKVKKEAGQIWEHKDTGAKVKLLRVEGRDWIAQDQKSKAEVKISGLTWSKYGPTWVGNG